MEPPGLGLSCFIRCYPEAKRILQALLIWALTWISARRWFASCGAQKAGRPRRRLSPGPLPDGGPSSTADERGSAHRRLGQKQRAGKCKATGGDLVTRVWTFQVYLVKGFTVLADFRFGYLSLGGRLVGAKHSPENRGTRTLRPQEPHLAKPTWQVRVRRHQALRWAEVTSRGRLVDF